jgi:ribonuclease HII
VPPTNKYEKHFKQLGFSSIAGVDEVGVGCLAGPVLAAAVILKEPIRGLDDSKKLSPDKRRALYQIIIKKASAIGLGIVDNQLIDKVNILKASHLAMRLAVEALKPLPDLLLIDGRFSLELPLPQLAIVKGDSKSPSIAAASIVAKVIRDHLMDKLDASYPQYGFTKHKGYGTALHRAQILKNGPSPLHRLSFLRNPLETQKWLDIEQLTLYNS